MMKCFYSTNLFTDVSFYAWQLFVKYAHLGMNKCVLGEIYS